MPLPATGRRRTLRLVAIGDRAGQFRIEAVLGAGGMGEVYVAVDERLQRRVALKAIKSERRLNEASKARFLREARVLSSLDHPNICRVYDYFEDLGRDFIVLELIEGTTLTDAIPTLTRSEHLRIASDIAGALAAAHTSGIVHRDLKPDNVMLTPDGEAKILDFGIARLEAAPDAINSHDARANDKAQADAASTLTMLGDIVGTPAYMSPEQARGEAATSATDMFAFGLLLQHLFTKAEPREPADQLADLLEAAQRGERRPLRGVDRGIAALIRQLTEVRPEQRPPAGETVRRLARIKSRRKRYALTTAASLLVLGGVAGAAKYTIDVSAERASAVAARQDAEAQIEFVLSDLKDKLDGVGRLDILEATAGEVLDYYQRRGIDGLSNDELVRYANGLLLIGEVQFQLGKFDLATVALDKQIELLERVTADEPTNGPAIKSLAAGNFWLGYIGLERGDIETMEQQMLIYRDLAKRLVGLDSSNPEWLAEEAFAYNNLGVVFDAQGKLAEATESFEQSNRIKRRLIEIDPADLDQKESLASGLAWLMSMSDVAGDLDAASQSAAEMLTLRRDVMDARPQNAQAKLAMCTALSHVGRLALTRAELPAALDALTEMQEIARRLERVDPGNPIYRRELAIAQRQLAEVMLAQGNVVDAGRSLDASAAILKELADNAPDSLDLAMSLAQAVDDRAQVELTLGRPAAALSLLDSIDQRSEIFDAAGTTAATTTLARHDLTRGRAYEALNEPSMARSAWSAALEHMDRIDGDDRSRVHVRALRAEVLARLGKTAEARRLLDGLPGPSTRWSIVAALVSGGS